MKTFIKNLIRSMGYSVVANTPPASLKDLIGFYPDTVIDIGANVGAFTAQAHKEFPLAYIISFEPIAECASQIKDATVYNVALGDKVGSVTFTVSPLSESSSFLTMLPDHVALSPRSKGGEQRQVPVKTLDSFTIYGQNIFIKSDTQGFEKRVIDGGEETFARAKAVMIENIYADLYDEQSTFNDVYQRLIDLGFRYVGNVGGKRIKGKLVFEDSLFLK